MGLPFGMFQSQVDDVSKKAGLKTDPYAGMPEYLQGFDPRTMSLSSEVDKHMGGTDAALQAYRGEALRKGPSAWANLANIQNQKQGATARERGANEVAGQTAQAKAALAQGGGLSSGARERVSEGGAKNYIGMSQDIAKTGEQNATQIGMNDEQNRMQQLGALPGLEMQRGQVGLTARTQDINNQVAENNQRNQFNMGVWGAGKQADQTNQPQKGGTFICTALKEQGYITEGELSQLRALMRDAFFKNADFFQWYFTEARYAVELAKAQKFDFGIIKTRFVDDILRIQKEYDTTTAQRVYALRAGTFCRQWSKESKFQDSMAEDLGWRNWLKIPKLFLNTEIRYWIYAQLKFKKVAHFAHAS